MSDIPFYKNLADNSHCFQACLKMLLRHVFPKERYSYATLDQLTLHKRNQWTWNTAALLFLAKKEFEVVNIENFDYRQFVEFGEKYLKMIWTSEVFEAQKKHSDFKQEKKSAERFIQEKRIKHIRRPAAFSEVEHYFRKGHIVLVPINPLVLEKKTGYASHIVLITDMDRRWVTFHDPGLPPIKNRKVSRSDFRQAMHSPYRESASLIALRHTNLDIDLHHGQKKRSTHL